MADFFNPLPVSVVWRGKRWPLSPAFDNVLNMYKQTEDGELTPEERLDVMLYYLIDGDCPRDPGLLQAALTAIIPPQKRKGSDERAFDYIQDAPYIYAAFRQAYGIDLIAEQGKMHWWKFYALLCGLPQNTRFAEIVQLRQRPLPKPTKHNARERAELLRLKALYRLDVTEAERQHRLYQGLCGMAQCLHAMAGRHEEKA